ncbi:hypothetical protein BG262_03070 [Floricoccus penangensis]|uniref:Plasmid pRiA4b Orf3-like domain-containing protein n=2 Tax=Floricoccus penangensis TaxID=1859475 RepID=A0A9Q5NZP0_9LACT|nr:hypothetical protein BG262_03070 [Floricoccus penangensis]
MTMFEMRAYHLFSLKHFNFESISEKIKNEFPNKFMDDYIELNKNNFLFMDKLYKFEDDDFYGSHTITLDPSDTKISSLKNSVGDRFVFNYDFGDGWQVNLVLKKFEREEVSLSTLPKVNEFKFRTI